MEDDRTLSDKLSGRFRHPEDAGARSISIGRLLRAPGPPGRIAALQIPEAPAGIVSIVNRDIPGSTRISIGGQNLPVLASRNLLWSGQPVLAAAGPDAAELDEWLNSIRVDFAENGEADDPDVAEPQAKSEFHMEKGDIGSGFSRAFQVVEETFSIPSEPVQGESRHLSCIRDGGSYVIHADTEWPGILRRTVARVLKVDRSNIRIRPYRSQPTAGNAVWEPAMNACLAALLSRAARKSVRLSLSPGEIADFAPRTPDVEYLIRGAIDGEGRVLALDISFSLTTGRYFPLESEYLDRMVMGLFNIYPCRNYRINGTIYRKNHQPSAHGPTLGFGTGMLMGEMFAARVAEHSLTPPGTWRRESFPVNGQFFGPGLALPRDFPLPDILGKTIGISDFERKHASYEQTRLGRNSLKTASPVNRGIGLSCGWFGNGFIASSRELSSASVSITLDMESVLTINLPVHSAGAPMRRAWALTAGEILGMDPSAIRFPAELPDSGNDPGPSILGRNAAVYTKLIEQCCNDLAKRRFRDALPITVSRSRRRSTRAPWNPEEFEGAAFETLSWGAAVVEMEVSASRGLPRPTRIWMTIDGGSLLMKDHARSAVEASVEKALNRTLGNRRASAAPLVDIQFHGDISRRTSRDVSTMPYLLIPAACVQAYRQATGKDISALPIIRANVEPGECG